MSRLSRFTEYYKYYTALNPVVKSRSESPLIHTTLESFMPWCESVWAAVLPDLGSKMRSCRSLLCVASKFPECCQATDWTSSSCPQKLNSSLAWIKSQMTRVSWEVVARMQSAIGWKFTVSTRRGCEGKTNSGWLSPVSVSPDSGIRHSFTWRRKSRFFRNNCENY